MNVDANQVVDNLCRIIAAQAKEIAVLKAKIDELESKKDAK